MKLSPRNYLLLLLTAAVLMLLPHLALLPVNIMEARNFITAREMINDHHWLLTTLNGEPRYEKPPLPTWITAFSGILFGQSLFGMRFPVVLICFLLLFMAWQILGKMELPLRQKFNTSLILLTSFYVWFSGRDNQWDMYCHSFALAGCYFLWKLFRHDGSKYVNAILAGLFISFSILSKGPVSLYALVLPFVVAYGVVYKFRRAYCKTNMGAILLMLLLALAIGLSWPIYVRYADPNAFLQATSREASRWNAYNTRPFYYYWNFFLQSGMWAFPSVIALLYPYMKKRVADVTAYRFTLLWTIFAIVLLSLIPEKKSRYLLPVLIPLAFTAGFYIDYLFDHFSRFMATNEKWPVYVSFGLLALIGLAFPALPFIFHRSDASLLPWEILSGIVLFGLGIFIIWSLIKNEFAKVFYAAIAVQVALLAVAFPLAKPLLFNQNYKSVDEARNIVNAENLPLYDFNSTVPEIVWEFGRKIPNYASRKTSETRFAILAIAEDSLKVQNTFGNHAVKRSFINLLTSARHPKKAKNRLYRDFYVVSLPPAIR
jgi:4-amino-4-deoxy-L-arabinose transferase-like glycosyltransferase